MEAEITCSTEIEWLPLQHEFFEYGPYEFNISRAKELLSESPHDIGLFEVKHLDFLIDMPESGKLSLTSVYVDWDKIRETNKVNLSVPVIFAWSHENDEGDRRQMLVDGHHRLAKALDDGVEKIPAVMLSKQESDAVRIDRSR